MVDPEWVSGQDSGECETIDRRRESEYQSGGNDRRYIILPANFQEASSASPKYYLPVHQEASVLSKRSMDGIHDSLRQ